MATLLEGPWCSVLRSHSGAIPKEQQEASLWSKMKSTIFRGLGLDDQDKFPLYWASGHEDVDADADTSEGSDSFDEAFPVPADDRQLLEALMNSTSGGGVTRFRLVRAVRVEKSELWHRYQQHAARLRRRRGFCHFAGRGAPLTAAALEGLHLADGFPEALDAGSCEAYLWHATKPHVAMEIVQDGFRVDSASALGKRFGRGGYFSEDAAKADSYAGAGEGIYKDCYAMLLCRVALGRQLRTDLFRWEAAAEAAGSRFDSVLAEPRGAAYREFVALEGAQIYPEFALVYERVESPEVEDSTLQRCLSSGDFPPYWSHSAGSSFFHATVADHEAESCVQSLMDLTWVRAFSCERRNSLGALLQSADAHREMPEGLRVLKVLRVEDSEMWNDYRATKAALRQARGRCSALGVKTARRDLPLCARAGLSADVSEAYLWHGSTPQAVTSIAEHGFPLRPGRGGTGPCQGVFGEGYYLVDCAAKADEHSEDDKDGYYRGYYAVLLCRVLLGKAQVLPGPDLAAHRQTGRGREFDSTVGDQVASHGAFREYVVPDRSQIYPEYAIIYERMYSVPRVR